MPQNIIKSSVQVFVNKKIHTACFYKNNMGSPLRGRLDVDAIWIPYHVEGHRNDIVQIEDQYFKIIGKVNETGQGCDLHLKNWTKHTLFYLQELNNLEICHVIAELNNAKRSI